MVAGGTKTSLHLLRLKCHWNGLCAKSPQRVIDDLKSMLPNHPNRLINMVDNIMPHQYFKSLLPRLADELPNVKIFYEQKSNLSLEKVIALKRSGVTLVQPGIESLSTPLLQRMRKGVTARQNINLLRYWSFCRCDSGVEYSLWISRGLGLRLRLHAQLSPQTKAPQSSRRCFPHLYRTIQSILRTSARIWYFQLETRRSLFDYSSPAGTHRENLQPVSS